MAYHDELGEWIVNRLMADAIVGPLTGGRVFKGQIAHLSNPTYPLVTFSRITPGDVEPKVPVSRFQLVFLTYSGNNYDEAWNLYEAIKASLDNENATVSGRTWVLEETNTPVEGVDDEPTQAFYVGSIFTVRQIG
jgi:hypothetical protein